jgi:hypothetical protein
VRILENVRRCDDQPVQHVTTAYALIELSVVAYQNGRKLMITLPRPILTTASLLALAMGTAPRRQRRVAPPIRPAPQKKSRVLTWDRS